MRTLNSALQKAEGAIERVGTRPLQSRSVSPPSPWSLQGVRRYQSDIVAQTSRVMTSDVPEPKASIPLKSCGNAAIDLGSVARQVAQLIITLALSPTP